MSEINERFPNPLITEHLEGRRFELKEPFLYIVNFKPCEVVSVPAGFITDLASIPKFFWALVGSPNGRYGKAAVIHDYLYFKQIYSRQKSDRIFYEAMQSLQVPFWRRWSMYHSVRTFAWIPWNRHKKRLDDNRN